MVTACNNFLELHDGFEEKVAEALRAKDPDYARTLDTEHQVLEPNRCWERTTSLPPSHMCSLIRADLLRLHL